MPLQTTRGKMKLFIKVTGVITFSILLVFSLLFYRERAITFDMARLGFYNILTRNFVFSNQRFGTIIPQLIPLMLRWLNYPLRIILMVRSAGFVVFYFAFFFVITFVQRQYNVALVFLLSVLLLVNDTFYWIQSELPQGLAWLILYYAYIEKRGVAAISRRPLLHLIFLLFIQSFHPLMVFPILYLLLYLLYQQHRFNWSFYKWPVAIVAINFCLRIWASKFNSYEGPKLDMVTKLQHHRSHLQQLFHFDGVTGACAFVLFGGLLLIAFAIKKRLYLLGYMLLIAALVAGVYGLVHWLHVPSIFQVLRFSATDYLVYWIVILFTVIVLAGGRKFYLLALLSLFTMGYLLLICLMNRSADKFYLENLMLPLGIFILLPFVQLLTNELYNFRKSVFPLLLVVICARLLFIFNAHAVYTNRLKWYRNKFEEMDKIHTQRLMLTEKNVPMDTLVMSWASGYESVLLSSINGPQYTKSIVIDKDLSDYEPYLKADTLLLAKWMILDDKELPSNYFIMRPGNYLTP